MNYQLSYAKQINGRRIGKPYEDMIRVDAAHNLFLVLDGITRVHAEYDGSNRSAAREVNRIFTQKFFSMTEQLEEIASPKDLSDTLRNMLLQANAALIPFRESKSLKQWEYYPGTVGILAVLWENKLLCLWAGDCIGLHLRDNRRRIIASQQTLAAKNLKYDKARIYAEVCNHPTHPCAYGIFNGDPQVEALIEQSWTELLPGDIVLLSTDGLSAYLQDAPISELMTLMPEQLMKASKPYDCPPYAEYADDKALLRLAFS